MTDRAPWEKYCEKYRPHITGEFQNQFGERYVIYRNSSARNGEATGDIPYITGDELDWKPRISLLWLTDGQDGFILSAEERDKIAKILWPVPFTDSRADLEMRTSIREYFDERERLHPGFRAEMDENLRRNDAQTEDQEKTS